VLVSGDGSRTDYIKAVLQLFLHAMLMVCVVIVLFLPVIWGVYFLFPHISIPWAT
jgi:hypothetical protein